MCQLLGCVQLFAAPWNTARQAPLPMEFSRQEYWSGLPFPSPVDHVLSEFFTMTCPSWVACMAWLIASLSYTSIFTMMRLWSMKGLTKLGKIVEDRGAWYVAVHGVAQSWTRLSDWETVLFLLWCAFCHSCKTELLKVNNRLLGFFCSLFFIGMEFWCPLDDN